MDYKKIIPEHLHEEYLSLPQYKRKTMKNLYLKVNNILTTEKDDNMKYCTSCKKDIHIDNFKSVSFKTCIRCSEAVLNRYHENKEKNNIKYSYVYYV